jgi:hypothetical protein
MKLNTVVSMIQQLARNVICPNIVNITSFSPQKAIYVPLVFFTDVDSSSVENSDFLQELEEIKMRVRNVLKSHIRSHRFDLITETVFLQNNISLLNSIQSTFIDSITLYNNNNTISYHHYRRIVVF